MQERTVEALIDWNLCSKLYGRKDQVRALTDAYNRQRRTASAELTLITGASGTGKSVLAQAIKTRVEDDWGFFVAGKFDEIQTPHAPFVAALEDFVKQVCLRGDVAVESIRAAVQKKLELSDRAILLEVVPKLSEIFGEDTQGNKEHSAESLSSSESDFKVGVGTESHSRFTSVLCRFLRSISSTERTVVLLLDDLQWADKSSLEILSSLLNPLLLDSVEGLVLVATCRGNEVSCHDDLSVVLRGMEERGTIITEIKVGNLTLHTLSEMVASLLELRAAECLSLAEIVHGKTGGNVFFAKQFLKGLLEEGILTKDPRTNKWVWDDAELLLALPTESCPNGQNDILIIQLLAKKMKQLPTTVVETLKLISCLGTSFSDDILFHSGSVVSSQILLALEVAVQQGFIAYDVNTGEGCWIHDKYREAAFSLMPSEDVALFRLGVGRSLRKQWPTDTVKANIILIVDLIKYGLSHVQDADERDDFARLFLRASREAAKASAFDAALKYAEMGIDLLEPRHWRDQYELSLDLYSTATELAYCTGKHAKVDVWADLVIANARCIGDKTRAIMTHIVALSSRGDAEEGIKLCLDHLQMLKEPYPRRGGKLRILLEFYRTKRALRNKNEEDILGLPKLSDPRAVASMQIILLLFPLFAVKDFTLTPLPAFRLINLTLKYGLSSLASIAFVLYSATLVRIGKLEEAARFGNLANMIIERYPSIQLEPKVHYFFLVTTQTVKKPWRSLLDPMLDCHRLSLKRGDVEVAMISVAFHTIFRVFLGDPLEEVSPDALDTERLCLGYGQLKVLSINSCVLQLCKNLQGHAKDPLALTGEFFDEDERLQQLRKDNLKTIVSIVLHLKYMLAAFMNEYHYADLIYLANKESFNNFLIPLFTVNNSFLRGLVALAQARASTSRAKKRRRIAEAKKQYEWLKTLLVHCPDNIINKLHLLEAELECCRSRYSSALLKYDNSIFYAEREGFLSDQALACEKAGTMLQNAGRSSDALSYLRKARALYERWGARVKVDQIDRLLSSGMEPNLL